MKTVALLVWMLPRSTLKPFTVDSTDNDLAAGRAEVEAFAGQFVDRRR